MRSKYFAESLGTFCLVFAGTGAVVVNQISGGQLGVVGVGLVFGMIVLAMIYSVGPISGAHMNPAVTLAFASAGRFPFQQVFPYAASQLAGALAASAFLSFIFAGSPGSLGATLPSGTWQQSFGLELVLTFILMFVIMGVSKDGREEGLSTGVAVGATVALEAIFGGPVSGASMNPARSFAPALLSGNLQHHWIYWLAPCLGGIFGAWTYQRIRRDGNSASPIRQKV